MVIMMSFKKSISIFDQGRERERERMEGSLNSAFFFLFRFLIKIERRGLEHEDEVRREEELGLGD
ncbi:Uncharacterized protein APZ42_021902 [Daphnia magna]|uniref:Uncharacterized protein n=1 Tax=Daphnia magna TaxID=35525 RepID=A0A164W8S4_9CRUS|nr:Uncharacterized protein APZ42_021902 [Daphnia magna]